MAAAYLSNLIAGRWKHCTSPLLLLADSSSVPVHSNCWQTEAVYLASLICGRRQQCTLPLLFFGRRQQCSWPPFLLADGSNVSSHLSGRYQQCSSPVRHPYCWHLVAVYLAALIVGRWHQRTCHPYCCSWQQCTCQNYFWKMAAAYLATLTVGRGAQCTVPRTPIVGRRQQCNSALLLLADGSSVIWHL
jgi:hypothetical protein